MPTLQEIQDYLARTGQNVTQQSQDVVNRNIDQPLAQKLNALQQASNNAAMQHMSANPTMTLPSQQMQPGAPEVAPNAETMSPQDARSRMAAMISGPEQMQQADTRLRAQAQQDQAAEEHANHIGEDMSGFTDVPKPGMRQFPQIQKRVQAQQPVTSQDIRSMTSPTKALSEDDEAKINKSFESKDDEDQD